MKETPFIAFTFRTTDIKEGDVFSIDSHPFEGQYIQNMSESYQRNIFHKKIKSELRDNLLIFLDNYLVCGGHEVFILKKNEDNYVVEFKIKKKQWCEDYWRFRKKDFENDPLSIDDDTYALLCTVCKKYNKVNKNKTSYKL